MTKNRKKSVRFHVDGKDYFSSLATTLGLIEEMSVKECGNAYESLKEIKHITSALKRLKDDLMYLQNNYDIIEKVEA